MHHVSGNPSGDLEVCEQFRRPKTSINSRLGNGLTPRASIISEKNGPHELCTTAYQHNRLRFTKMLDSRISWSPHLLLKQLDVDIIAMIRLDRLSAHVPHLHIEFTRQVKGSMTASPLILDGGTPAPPFLDETIQEFNMVKNRHVDENRIIGEEVRSPRHFQISPSRRSRASSPELSSESSSPGTPKAHAREACGARPDSTAFRKSVSRCCGKRLRALRAILSVTSSELATEDKRESLISRDVGISRIDLTASETGGRR